MRLLAWVLAMGFVLGGFTAAEAKTAPAGTPPAPAPPVEVTADQTLEWYQDQSIYVARGNAKAVRGDLTVYGDTLTAHEREKPKDANGKVIKTPKPPANQKSAASSSSSDESGDIDRMTADGHVLILKPNTRITGEHAVDDTDKHVIVVTGNNLRYETDKQVVTARDTGILGRKQNRRCARPRNRRQGRPSCRRRRAHRRIPRPAPKRRRPAL